MLGVALDEPVNFYGMIGSNAKEIFREAAHFAFRGLVLGPKGAADLVGRLLAHIGLKEHLQD
jgi:hypothetical protein